MPYSELKGIVDEHRKNIMFDDTAEAILKPYIYSKSDLDKAVAIFKYGLTEKDFNEIFSSK